MNQLNTLIISLTLLTLGNFSLAKTTKFKTSEKLILSKKFEINSKILNVQFYSSLSSPNSNGKGYCGVGEEIQLKVISNQSHKIIFTKLIESCLKNITLKDGSALGMQNESTLLKGIEFTTNEIILNWINYENEEVSGVIDLSSSKPKFKLVNQK